MEKYASFDLEIATDIPEGTKDWREVAPLGISCASLAFSDNSNVRFWESLDFLSLTPPESRNLVYDLMDYWKDGYKIVTWNGCGFDFAVLAQESELLNECAILALEHVDLMLNVTFVKGYMLGLDAALSGMGLAGKKHIVTLSDGSTLEGMSGKLAPKLWRDGERKAVLDYLSGDVEQPIQLVNKINAEKSLHWNSKSGKFQILSIPKLLTVRECFLLPEPDTSWMTNPPVRSQFVDWIPDWKERLAIGNKG